MSQVPVAPLSLSCCSPYHPAGLPRMAPKSHSAAVFPSPFYPGQGHLATEGHEKEPLIPISSVQPGRVGVTVPLERPSHVWLQTQSLLTPLGSNHLVWSPAYLGCRWPLLPPWCTCLGFHTSTPFTHAYLSFPAPARSPQGSGADGKHGVGVGPLCAAMGGQKMHKDTPLLSTLWL